MLTARVLEVPFLRVAKFLKEKESKGFLLETIGEEGIAIIKAISDGEATDEELAADTGFKLNFVRRILYKLYDKRLASYVRTKDKDIGWYIYTWKLDLSKINDILAARKRNTHQQLIDRLDYERSHVFFTCKEDDSKVPFDIASETDFKCPKCDSIMEHVDNKRVISDLEREVKRLERQIRH